VLPIKDNVPTRTFPLVTVSLIAVNVVVWLWEWRSGVNSEVLQYGYYPCSLEGPCVSPASTINHVPWYEGAFTSMFLHASWIHIGGNMLFLWIFGDNVEDRFGHLKFLIFYLLAGVAATFSQYAVSPESSVPNVGASGAIAGVLGAYILMFPQSRVNVLLGRQIVAMPAFVVLGLWIVLQLVSGVGTIAYTDESTGGVAYMAHIGGFISGVAMTFLFRGQSDSTTTA